MAYRYPVDTFDLFWDGDALTTGESTFPRRICASASIPSGNGSLRLSYFTARKSETVTQIRSLSGSTAQVGATLCRTGVYSVNASTGNLTLVASTPNDTTLWTSTLTVYTKSFSASFAKERGTRYAVGHLIVGSSTAPQFQGPIAPLIASECAQSPALGSLLGSQTDLPSSVTAGSLTGSGVLVYSALLP